MTLNQYHKKVIAYRKQDLSFRFIFKLIEDEYFTIHGKPRYKNLNSFRINHFKFKVEQANRRIK